MQIQITKPFYEKSLSPLAFQQNEYVTMPDEVAQRLIDEGKAVPLATRMQPEGVHATQKNKKRARH